MQPGNTFHFSDSSASRDTICLRTSPRAVVCVGRDRDALKSHEQEIRSRSDLMVRCLTPEEAESAARSAQPRLWIFCGGIELSKLVYLACSVRRFSRDSRLVLECRRAPGFEASLFDEIIQPPEATDALLEAVSYLALAV